MKFQCSKCGLCCQKKYLDTLSVPFLRNPDNGNCIHLSEDNLCMIYEDRPLICRTDELYDYAVGKWGQVTGDNYTKPEWFTLGSQKCNQMQDEAGLPLEFRIDVSKYINLSGKD